MTIIGGPFVSWYESAMSRDDVATVVAVAVAVLLVAVMVAAVAVLGDPVTALRNGLR
jgi:hypothetical protein